MDCLAFLMNKATSPYLYFFTLKNENNKPYSDIIRGYGITSSALECWIKNHEEIESLKNLDNQKKILSSTNYIRKTNT